MPEAILVVGGVLALLAVSLVPAQLGVTLGAAMILVCLLGGCAAGLGYHIALHRALSPRGLLPRFWWWNPTALHPKLVEAQRTRVMPWFYAGAAGMIGCLLGCAAIVSSFVRQF